MYIVFRSYIRQPFAQIVRYELGPVVRSQMFRHPP